MYSYEQKNNEPICRFGPGGEYSYNWPDMYAGSNKRSPNSLAKLLETIGEIINTVMGNDLYITSTVASIKCPQTNEVVCRKEKIEYAVKNSNSDQPAYTQTTTVIKSNSPIPIQQLLFTDDYGTGEPDEYKQKHHIRTHKRAAKKRAGVTMHGQSSLFGDNTQIARSA